MGNLDVLAGKAKVKALPGWPPKPISGQGIRILFVNPPSVPYNILVKGLAHHYVALNQTVAMPMGILYLCGVLERDLPGVEILIVDLAKAYREYSDSPTRVSTTFEEFTRSVLVQQVPPEFVPDFAGVSVLFSTAHKSTGRIADVLKKLWSDAPVLVGGMHATNAVETLLECSSIDYICRGEAESIIVQVAQVLKAKGDCETIEGIIGRNKLNTAAPASAPHESAPLIYDLDTIPMPAWHLIDMEGYVHNENSRARQIDQVVQDGEATIVTTRGCPFHCTFCSSWTVHGREMRYRSVANVIDELTILRERYQVSSVIPEDDLFSVKKARIVALCNAVAEKFGRTMNFQFPNGLSVATLDEDVINAMARMGMTVANIAIESGSSYVQKCVIKKNVDLTRARRVIQACRDAGIVVRAYFILGFPGETRAQMEETIAYAASLPTDWNVFNVAAPLIGTEMYEQLLERGAIDKSFNWDDAFFHERSFDTPEISAQGLKNLAYGANLRINFFGNHNLRTGNFKRAIGLFQDILSSYHGHLAAQYCIALAHRAAGEFDAYREAIAACNQMLVDRDEMACGLYSQYMDLFPDLTPPVDLVVPSIRTFGPRPGLPTQARQTV